MIESKERDGRNRDKFLKAINQTNGSKKPVRTVILANYWMPKLDGVETNEKKTNQTHSKENQTKNNHPQQKLAIIVAPLPTVCAATEHVYRGQGRSTVAMTALLSSSCTVGRSGRTPFWGWRSLECDRAPSAAGSPKYHRVCHLVCH